MTGNRVDARRNRQRVLEAAEAVFGEKGVTASTEEVAVRAGVGIATVFRHFPTKQALLEAIVLTRLERLLEVAQEIVANDDPDGFFQLFARFFAEASRKRDFGDVLTHAGDSYRSANAALVDELWAAYAILIARGQSAGRIRPGFEVADVSALLAGAHQSLQVIGNNPARRQLLLEMLMDGVRGQTSSG